MTRRTARFTVWGQVGGLQVTETQLKPPPALVILGAWSTRESGRRDVSDLLLLLSSPLSHFRTYAVFTRVLCWQWEGTQRWAAPGSLHLSRDPRGRKGPPSETVCTCGPRRPWVYWSHWHTHQSGPVTREGCLAERRADFHLHGAANNRWKEVEAGP